MSGTSLWVALAFVGVGLTMGVAYVISIYNSLVQVRNNIEKAWKNIDVLLQQRHDELLKLVEAVRGYMQHERQVLDSLTELRVGYDGAKSTDERIQIENRLNKEIAQLRHVWEAYPDLKANQNFLQLQGRISGIESSISDRREFLNDSVNIYNIQIERFPELLAAKVLGYRRRPFLEVPEDGKADVRLGLG